MKFSVSSKIFKLFPDAHFGTLLLEGIDNNQKSPEIKNLLDEQIIGAIKQYNDVTIKNIPQISIWREIFKKLDLNRDFLPSHEALLTRVRTKKSLPDINPLVNIYNIISLKYLIPVGGHDTDKVSEIRIDKTKGCETFQVMNSKEVIKIKKGEIAYLDCNKVLTRHFVWRQSDTDKTDTKTKNVFIPIDDASGKLTPEKIRSIAEELISIITKYLGGRAKFGIVNKDNNFIDFNLVQNISMKNIPQQKSFTIDPRWKKYMEIPKIQEPNMDVITDEKKVDYALTRAVKDIFPTRKQLKKILMSGKRIRLYCGIDPTANFLHVGHFVHLRKLAQFQQLGHQVIYMMGAFTAMIGDPDKKYTREPLTKDQAWENFKDYKKTASKFINFDWEKNPVTILNNYDWLSQVKLEDWLQIMGNVTLQHLLSHEMFETRLKEQKPIRVHETMYPLLQGFDSVVMNIDLEVGGSDQTFNMLTGRILSKEILNKEKFVLSLKLITDACGNKVGKTTGNAISSKDSPEDMYGKIMSWTDETLLPSFEMLTDENLEEVEKNLKKESPMNSKKKLAFAMVKILHGKEIARKAQEHFEKTVQNKEAPEKMAEVEYKGENKALEFAKFLVRKGIIASNAEAKRLIEQKGIEIDGRKVSSFDEQLELKKGSVVKVGKRKFIKITSSGKSGSN